MLTILNGIESTSAALNAERIRMEVIAQNIANANTTRGPDGRPYQRQEVVFESVLQQRNQALAGLGASPSAVQVARIQKDNRPLRMVYNPTHPDANGLGMVATPNINTHEEMADLISAARSFEANLAVVKTARTMAQQTLSIGKR